MTQSESNARKIFEQAIDITEVHQRNEFIQSACIGDSELLTQVEALLLAHQNAAGILETSAKNESQPASSSSAETSDGKSQDYQLKSTRDSIRDYRQSEVIGPYKLLQEIGSGGMGQVWMAEQQKPVRRRVAVKLIKAGMDTKLVIARFEAERQALALMDHPHIAKVFDAGTTDDGRPFFVMEYVRGKSITQFADDNHLSIPERLELFEQVCNAIQHAHHKGIIHRDLKPNNVLVSAPDGKPISKVIDFGIAKATSHQLTDLTLYTMHDQFIGTPQYMSPEQAAGSVDIDTRTDVYSLGVILFELLTGSTPFPKEELQAAGLEKIKAIIMEKEPPKPSTHISLSEQTIDSLAASRKVEPKGLGVLVRGELDWIVMKALDKERTRRYATPNNFAEDILAYLKGEPIDAAPPSRIYRLQKFIRMNRGQVLIGSMVLLLLILGLGGTTWGLLRTQRQRVERQETIAEDQQAIAQRHLTQGILRPIGFGKSDNRLNASELTSFHDWSQLSDSKLKVQVLRQAFENPESALRLARRGERSLQACIGTSLTRHAAVLDHLNQLQTDTTVDLRISFAACWLAAHLGDADLPGLESVIDRVLNQTPTSREAISANDLAMFGDAWVKGATDANQIDRTFNLLLLIADKTEDDDVLRNVGANVCDLVIRLKDNQILQAWDLMIDVAETYDNFFDGEIASAGFRNLALHMEQPQIQRAWDSLLGRVVTKEVGSLRYDIEPFIVGLAALASRLEGQQIDAALNSMADVVRGTDNWLGLSVTAASIEAMLPMLERKRTEIALDSLIEIVNKSGKRENLESANRVLRELATGLEGQQLEEAWGSLIKIAKRRSGFYFFNYKIDVDFESFAGRLNSEQIGRALVELIEIFENTNDEENLEVSVEALSALASHLDSDQAEPALDNLINRFANIEDQDVLKFAGKAMAILATRLDSQPASDAWDSILGGVRRADSEFNQTVAGKTLEVLAANLDSQQIDSAWDSLTQMVRPTASDSELMAVGHGYAGLASELKAEQVDESWDILIEIVTRSEDRFVLKACGSGLSALAASMTNETQRDHALETLGNIAGRSYANAVIPAADGLEALIPRLDDEQLIRTRTWLLDILQSTDESPITCTAMAGFKALSPRLEPEQIPDFLGSLARLHVNTDDPFVRRATGHGVIAVVSRIGQLQAQESSDLRIDLTLDRLIELLTEIMSHDLHFSSDYVIAEITRALLMLAPDLENQQLDRTWRALVETISEVDRGGMEKDTVYRLGGEGLVTLAGRMKGEQAQSAWNVVIDEILSSNDKDALAAVREGWTSLAVHQKSQQIDRDWNSMIKIVRTTGDESLASLVTLILLDLAEYRSSQQVHTAIESVLARWLWVSANRGTAQDPEVMFRVLKLVSRPSDIGNWLEHPGAVGKLRIGLLLRLDEIAYHAGRPVYCDFWLTEVAAEAKRLEDDWTETDETELNSMRESLPLSRIRTPHDAALWLRKQQPAFDLDKR